MRAFLVFLAAAALLLNACTSTPSYEKRDLPVDAKDVRILEQADQILSDQSKWNRQDNRDCDPKATTWSLFCALQAASIEVLGAYDHRRVALQEVRFAIEDVSGGREFEHRLMDYNNLSTTSFQDIKKVLAIAKGRVEARLQKIAG
jgi:hypothetical protein